MAEEAKKAWDEAPESFRKSVAQMGLKPPVDIALERHPRADIIFSANEADDHIHADESEPIESQIDTEMDRLTERFGGQYRKVIEGVVAHMQAPIRESVDRDRAEMIATIVCVLVRCDGASILARVHQLLHAIPRLALLNGFGSMSASAEACGVSREWIRRGRDEWCAKLGVRVPAEGRKSAAACLKYKLNATTNHWRNNASQKPTGPIRKKPEVGRGIATIHGVGGEFSIWENRVGGVDGIRKMGPKAVGEVRALLAKMAAMHAELATA